MDQSLSIVLPAHNAQDRLAAQVHELLEVLPDLASRFEVLIVDDGSTDQTDEIAHDLARQFPQLRAIRHGLQMGADAVLRTAVRHSSGDVVLVHDGRSNLNVGDMRKLCRPTQRTSRSSGHRPASRPADSNAATSTQSSALAPHRSASDTEPASTSDQHSQLTAAVAAAKAASGRRPGDFRQHLRRMLY